MYSGSQPEFTHYRTRTRWQRKCWECHYIWPPGCCVCLECINSGTTLKPCSK